MSESEDIIIILFGYTRIKKTESCISKEFMFDYDNEYVDIYDEAMI